MKHLIIIISFFFVSNTIKAQQIFYQDIFNGGVTGGGYTATTGAGTGSFNLFIPSGSTIQYAFLFSGCQGNPIPVKILLNGLPYTFNKYNQISNTFLSPTYAGIANVHAINITDYISPIVTNYTIKIPPQHNSNLNALYTDFYLIVGYKNPSLSEINSTIIINNQDFTANIKYKIKNINPINLSNQVSFTLMTGYICDTITDGSYVNVSNSQIGLIGGHNYNSNGGCGVFGFFYYQNYQLMGLGNNSANITMNGSDGIANISSYLNNTDSIQIMFKQQTNPNHTNSVWANFLTYRTPCDTFTTSLSADTAICAENSVQLHASGGIKYKWQPAYGLSCTSCANPIASPDSSVTYTVRIYNNDSCSKVLPVRVKVHQIKPKIETTPATCGDKNGSVKIKARNIAQYSLDSLSNSNGEFNHLQSGAYNITLTDSFGCTWQDTINVGFQNTAYAGFGVFPKDSGRVPLHIYTNNASQHTNKYIWAVNGDSLYTSTISYTFDKAGHYILTLIACHNSYPCCDTMSKEIVVTPLSLDSVPNVFTPNGDGINDKFTINLSGVERGKISIFNRWGILLYHTYMQEANAQHNLKLQWNGKTEKNKDCSAGTYYYVINYIAFGEGEKTVKGNVTLLR